MCNEAIGIAQLRQHVKGDPVFNSTKALISSIEYLLQQYDVANGEYKRLGPVPTAALKHAN